MSKYKFEEEVVEEKVEETTVEESTPDSHETFVNILVEMGLSAEQAEAVHQMAMDLIDASEGEITEEVSTETTETTEKVEASRQRRGRGSLRRSEGRKQFNKEGREARMLSRLRRQNIELRKQLREFGQSPATKPLRNAPYGEVAEESKTNMGKATAAAFNMINKNLSK